MGDIAHLYPRNSSNVTCLASFRIDVFATATGHLLFNHYESPLHFVQHNRELSSQQRLPRIDDHVHVTGARPLRQPYRFPQPPLHTIAHHRATQCPPHCKSHARARTPRGRPRQIKHSHRSGKMPPPLLVNPLKIGMAQKSTAARETNLLPPRLRSVRLFLGSGGAHGDCLGRESDRDEFRYSRKPGFTETRLRPLARRRDSTFWPPWVFMRVRKPCFLDRLRRLGWNVRLGMKSSCS